MFSYQDFPVKDFTGGITDYYLEGEPSRFQVGDNLFISKNKGLQRRPGCRVLYGINSIIPGSGRVFSVVKFGTDLLFVRSDKVRFFNQTFSSWDTVSSFNGVLSSLGSVGDYGWTSDVWNNYLFLAQNNYVLPKKVCKSGGSWRWMTVGLPEIVAPSVTASHNDGKSYIFAFTYVREHVLDDGVAFLDEGPPSYVELVNGPDFNLPGRFVSFGSYAGAPNEYSSTGVRLYRTEAFGVVPRFAGNLSVIPSDDTKDSELGDALYTNGGVVEADAPPACNFVVIVNGVAYYAGVLEGTEKKPFRVRYSVQHEPDVSPGDFYFDVDGAVAGVGKVGNVPVVMTKDTVYRVEGYRDSFGNGSVRAKPIKDSVGCVSASSVVSTSSGLFFAGSDGFYYTDGNEVLKVSEHLSVRYPVLISDLARASRISGFYDRVLSRVYWCVTEDLASAENDRWYVLDLNFGLSAKGSFTTCSFGPGGTSSCGLADAGSIVRVDANGVVYQHKAGFSTDVVYQNGVAANLWPQRQVDWSYVSSAFSFGTESQRKLVSSLYVVCERNVVSHIDVGSCNDDSGDFTSMKQLEVDATSVWGDDSTWGDETQTWNSFGVLTAVRRFPAGGLRCTYKQVRFSNGESVIADSSASTSAVLDSALYSVTLTDPTVFEFKPTFVGAYIRFENDGFVRRFKIASTTVSSLVVEGNLAFPASGTYEWIIDGHNLDDEFGLLSYSLKYAYFGDKTHASVKGAIK